MTSSSTIGQSFNLFNENADFCRFFKAKTTIHFQFFPPFPSFSFVHSSRGNDLVARVHSPDKTQLQQDLERTPTGVDFTPTRRELTSTRLDFTPTKQDFLPNRQRCSKLLPFNIVNPYLLKIHKLIMKFEIYVSISFVLYAFYVQFNYYNGLFN